METGAVVEGGGVQTYVEPAAAAAAAAFAGRLLCAAPIPSPASGSHPAQLDHCSPEVSQYRVGQTYSITDCMCEVHSYNNRCRPHVVLRYTSVPRLGAELLARCLDTLQQQP